MPDPKPRRRTAADRSGRAAAARPAGHALSRSGDSRRRTIRRPAAAARSRSAAYRDPPARALLERAGFRILAVEDLTAEWGVILAERLAMYRALRQEAERAGTPPGHDAFHESYVRFVALVQAGELGGARFTAEKR